MACVEEKRCNIHGYGQRLLAIVRSCGGHSHVVMADVLQVLQPALTKVSKDIRNETLPMFYGQHRFVFTILSRSGTQRERDFEEIFKWLRAMGKRNVGMLRDVKVKIMERCDPEDLCKLETLSDFGLRNMWKTLRVEVIQSAGCESCLLQDDEAGEGKEAAW